MTFSDHSRFSRNLCSVIHGSIIQSFEFQPFEVPLFELELFFKVQSFETSEIQSSDINYHVWLSSSGFCHSRIRHLL